MATSAAAEPTLASQGNRKLKCTRIVCKHLQSSEASRVTSDHLPLARPTDIQPTPLHACHLLSPLPALARPAAAPSVPTSYAQPPGHSVSMDISWLGCLLQEAARRQSQGPTKGCAGCQQVASTVHTLPCLARPGREVRRGGRLEPVCKQGETQRLPGRQGTGNSQGEVAEVPLRQVA